MAVEFPIWAVVISVPGIVGTLFLVVGFFDITKYHLTRIADWKRAGVLSA